MSHWYFSRARLLPAGGQAAWLSSLASKGDAYRDHALMWQLFPGEDQARDFVFRSECTEPGGQVYYIVSARPPVPSPLFQVQTKPYAPVLHEGELLRFDLRANPSLMRAVPGQRSRRHDVLMDAKKTASPENRAAAMQEAGLQWLLDRAAAWGLAVAAHTVVQSAYRQHRLSRKGQPIRFSSLDYLGMATVTDPERLQQALCEGVGRARGFGCGLLLVKRF